MWGNPFLNAADAFVAAWLPGSEGGGIADLLFGRSDFRGKLPFSWPKASDQTSLNIGDTPYDPLFRYGYGLTFADNGELPKLAETRAAPTETDPGRLFAAGRPGAGWQLLLGRPGALTANPAADVITIRPADRAAQGDSVRIGWTGTGDAVAAIVQDKPIDLTRQSNGDLALVLDVKVNAAPSADVNVMMRCGANCGGSFPVRGALAAAANNSEWTRLAIPLRCFAKAGADMAHIDAPLMLETAGRLDLTLSSARIDSPVNGKISCN